MQSVQETLVTNIVKQTQKIPIHNSILSKNMQQVIHFANRKEKKEKARLRWQKIEQLRLERLEYLD